ncbi:MAG: hypothetical protein O9329_18245 [Microcystis sp. LE19-12.2C]|nr:hypothetical protein [Microcystis sp. LE19-12.2C]MCZ8085151.1 hypothetical protein [Paracoccaceae bacterium]
MTLSPALVPYIRPFAFGLARRAEAWRLIADLIAARLDAGQAIAQAAEIYRMRGKALTAHLLMDLRVSISQGEFITKAAEIAPGAESLLFARFGRADAGRIFEGAARIARAELVMRRAITSAIAKPVLLIVLTYVLYYVLGTQLFPQVEQIQPRSTWPASAQVIAAISDFLVNNVFLVIGVTAISGFAIRASLSVPFPGRMALDRLPPWSLYKLRMASAFLFAIVETARTGGELKTSTLQAMAEHANPYIKDRITNIAKHLPTANIGQAALAAGQDFPARDLNAILALVAAQDGWIERFAAFLERWIADIELTIQRATAGLNVALLLLITLSLGAAISNILAVLQTLQ